MKQERDRINRDQNKTKCQIQEKSYTREREAYAKKNPAHTNVFTTFTTDTMKKSA